MRIAIIGWGSLVWSPEPLKITKPFSPIGPQLSIEFARISGDGRLTLVVDEKVGTICQTYCAPSACTDIPEAVKDLQKREGTPSTKHIYFHSLAGPQSRQAASVIPNTVKRINDWLIKAPFDAAVWTGLPANFEERRKMEFTPVAAVNYLETLNDERKLKALEYIENAPDEIQTPVRIQFNKPF
ncbi:MAG: hypothetical protein AAFY56_20800, partial [Pseudomonadota bacterium]